MNKQHPRRSALLAFGLLLITAFCGFTWHTVRQEQRQYRLNRALIGAILNYDTDRAIALLRDGADPNTREQPDPIPPFWQQWRDILLRRKRPVNDSDPALVLIMDSTVERPKNALTDNDIPRENARLVSALLDKGAHVNARSFILETALHQAIDWRYTDTVHILLVHNADVSIAMSGGNTPLMAATMSGDEKITRLLLERGANPDMQNGIGYTALMDASCPELPPQVLKRIPSAELRKYHLLPLALKVLLQYHPNLTLKNRTGETALAYARKQHQTIKVRLLMQAGAKE